MDSQQRSALLLLAGAFPQAISGDAGLAVWSTFLAAVPGDVLTAVVREWITTEDRAPTIAAILARVDALSGVDPEAAWQEVERILMGRRWDDPGFTCDPRMLAAVNVAGGWQVLRHMDDKDRPWRKKEFLQGWKDAKQRAAAVLALNGTVRGELSDGR